MENTKKERKKERKNLLEIQRKNERKNSWKIQRKKERKINIHQSYQDDHEKTQVLESMQNCRSLKQKFSIRHYNLNSRGIT